MKPDETTAKWDRKWELLVEQGPKKAIKSAFKKINKIKCFVMMLGDCGRSPVKREQKRETPSVK